MKILYLNAYFYPEDLASSYLGHNVREALAKSDSSIVLFAPTPSRGVSKEMRKEYSSSKKREIWYDGKMSINRFSLFAEANNPLLRAFRYVLVALKLFNRAVFNKSAKSCDVMVIPSTPPIMGLISGWAKKINHIPIIYLLQDVFPVSLVGTGMTYKGSLLWKIGRWIENYTYKNADKIIVISHDFKKNIMMKGVPEDKIVLIYNWVDENAILPVNDEDNDLFETFGISRDKFRVLYAGNLGNAQNIQIIVDAARRFRDNDKIEFIVFGKGGQENEIKETKMKEQLDNLKIFPLQPYDRVAKVYGLGCVCIVACKPGLGGAAMPSKTWSILSSGRAVLANFDDSELKEILEENKCGIFTKSGDIDSFVSAIKKLAQNPEICVEMGKNGRQFILDNLTREVGTRKYVEVIGSVALNSPNYIHH